MRRFLLYLLVFAAPLGRASASCAVTTFHPLYPPFDQQALALTDPAGEQTALFSMTWGGILASLKYKPDPSVPGDGTELVWGHAPGGMVQPALHHGSPCFEYNPTPAGSLANSTLPSALYAAACTDTQVTTISGNTDYNPNIGGLARGNVVYSGQVSTATWAAPYFITTYATFVPNTAASTPHYYLQLDQFITNVDTQENVDFFLELAGYGSYSFPTQVRYPDNCVNLTCSVAGTRALLGGLYPTSSLTGGVAFGVAPSVYWSGSGVSVTLGVDQISQNYNVHLENGGFTLPPGVTRHFVWYVMAGDWSTAVNFVSTH